MNIPYGAYVARLPFVLQSVRQTAAYRDRNEKSSSDCSRRNATASVVMSSPEGKMIHSRVLRG